MATFIDHIRCGGCDAGITLEAANVAVQGYRHQPWLRHFWVHCEVCTTHKLYWATARQFRLAEGLRCRMLTREWAPADVRASYAESQGWAPPPPPPRIVNTDLPFLVSMLAATSGLVRGPVLNRSYLPPAWSN